MSEGQVEASDATGQGMHFETVIMAPFGAAQLGYDAVAFDPVHQSNAGTSRLITAGVLNLIGVEITDPTAVVGNADLYLIGAGATLTAGQSLIGFYNSAGTLLGSSADQSTAWAGSAGFKAGNALTPVSAGSLSNLPPGLYWVALLSVGTTMPSFSAANGSPAVSALIMNGHAPAAQSRYGTVGSGLTALPASFTPSSITPGSLAWWAGVY